MDTTQVSGTPDNAPYLKKSWQMLTAEKGWYKPILVLAAVFCVPVVGTIFGTIASIGYALEWARLTAWGIDSVPKQRGVNVGKILSSGWRGFAVSILWALAVAVAFGILSALFSLIRLQFIISFLQFFASLLVAAVALVAALRAAVYQRFGAGFGFKQIYDMIRRDPNGFFRVFGIQLLASAVVSVIMFILSMMLLAAYMPAIIAIVGPYIETYRVYGTISNADATRIALNFVSMMASWLPGLVVFKFLVGGVSFGLQLLAYNACGLWFRQFDVPSWGSPSDPLPESDAGTGRTPTL